VLRQNLSAVKSLLTPQGISKRPLASHLLGSHRVEGEEFSEEERDDRCEVV